MDQAWIDRVTDTIGGYNELVTYLVNKICTQQKKLTLLRQHDSSMTDPGFLSKGVILHGKPGTGKTALSLALAKASNLPFYVVNGPDVFQTEEGASETKLRSIFHKAKKTAQETNTMVILIVDELDMLAGKLTRNKTGLDTRITSMLQSCIDQLDDGMVFVLGLTNRLHAVDSSFLRSGRLDDIQELVIKLPSQRYSILCILSKKLPFSTDQERTHLLSFIAQHTHSFVPSDLSSLCGQLVLQLVKEEAMDLTKKPTLQQHHIDKALSSIRPANMNMFSSRVPTTRFTDLYGIDDVIEDVKTSVIYPFQQPDQYIQLGIAPPRGIMFYGPPGTGKTMLCSALASEAGVNFIFVESTQLRSKVVGESEKNIANMFAHARSNSPCILFIDQIDMLLPKRGTGSSSENTSDRIVTGFLTEMDGLLTKSNSSSMQMDVLVVAATNRLHMVDSAVLRPGRFDEHIELSLPDQTQRLDILRGLARKMPLDLTDEEFQDLAFTHTVGWSGAELDNLLREAAMVCLRQDITNEKINRHHIDHILLQKQSLV